MGKTGSRFLAPRFQLLIRINVFRNAHQAYIKLLKDGTIHRITEIVGVNVKDDLCVFRVEADDKIPLLRLSMSPEPIIGDDIYVVSNPIGLEGSFSKGVISALRKADDQLEFIQIDAAISHGSSGAPIVNKYGYVIGIAKGAIEKGQSLNFAIPVNKILGVDYVMSMTVEEVSALVPKVQR